MRAFSGTAKKYASPMLISQDVKSKRDLRDMTFIYATVAAVFVLLAFTFVFLWSRMTFVRLGYEISRAGAAKAGLDEKSARLRLEHEKLRSPERIERIAAKELGFEYATGARTAELE